MSAAGPGIAASNSLFERAALVTPGGVHSPVRAFRSVGSPPLAITDAWGARVRDADGLDYVDWIGAWGPALFGHNPAFVREAIERQLARGVLFGLMSPPEVELAERVTARVPGMDMVRFVATGPEAAMGAPRLGPGGAARRFGVTPDLVLLGKALGGGMPLAAYGGRRDLMRRIAPEGPVYQAGTHAAHPLSVAAGLAVMDALDADPGLWARLE